MRAPASLLALAALAQASNQTYNTSGAWELANSQVLYDPFPYFFPKENASTRELFAMPLCQGVKIEDATIDQLQAWMANGTFTSVQLTNCYLRRVDQTNQFINSVLELNPDVIDIASKLDQERANGQVRGPLHGIPFLVKDNIATKDKMQTCSGSLALLGNIVPRDAHVVWKLREAGAVLLGHATLSEWADMRSSNYSEGYSGRGGQARNSYNFTVNPGGSSSGSGISVSNNVVPFALGTETDGSVINPAERNNIVGIKPTVGLTSRAGVIPESTHQDTVGTFGKTVRDATYVLDAIYGVDPRDNVTSSQIGQTPPGGYAQFLSTKDALKGLKFGIPWLSFWVLADPEQLSYLLQIVSMIEEAGGTIVNGTELPYYKEIVDPDGWNWAYRCELGYPNECEYTYVKVDFYNNIKSYLSEVTNTEIKDLADIVAYNDNNDGTEGGTPGFVPAFGSGQDQFLESLATGGIMNSTYWEALAYCHYTTREAGIDAALHTNGTDLDALIVPPDVAQTTQVPAQAGYPMLTIPAYVHSLSGMPFGFAFIGTAYSEATLIKSASAVEDLLVSSDSIFQRKYTPPQWEGYLERIEPLANQCYGC